jgi:hypothetical protein
MITNKIQLIKVLTNNCGPLTLSAFTTCCNLEEKIVLDPSNDKYERFEVYMGIILALHEYVINEDEFELAKLITKNYNHNYKKMKKITDSTEDEETMWWLYFADEYYQKTIQLQLNNYN